MPACLRVCDEQLAQARQETSTLQELTEQLTVTLEAKNLEVQALQAQWARVLAHTHVAARTASAAHAHALLWLVFAVWGSRAAEQRGDKTRRCLSRSCVCVCDMDGWM